MAGAPLKAEVGAHDGIGLHRIHPVDGGGVPGVDKVHLVKETGPGHELLGAGALFGRAAKVDHGAVLAGGIQVILEGESSCQRASAQRAVAAAVAGGTLGHRGFFRQSGLLAQAGEGIKFPQEAHHRFAAALFIGAGKAGGDFGQATLNGEALGLQQLAEQLGGLVLVEGELGIVPDAVVGIQNVGGVFCHRFPDQFQISHTVSSFIVLLYYAMKQSGMV